MKTTELEKIKQIEKEQAERAKRRFKEVIKLNPVTGVMEEKKEFVYEK